MTQILLSLLTGLVAGAVFRLLGLPVPAPPVLAGVAGVFGLWLGGYLAGLIRR
jgi:XapX domain-containing protein